jgi:hypothetical protein
VHRILGVLEQVRAGRRSEAVAASHSVIRSAGVTGRAL